jgi:hypothetical protein
MAGGSVSLTVTVNEQVPVLPVASVAVHVTVVVPTAKKEPDAGTQDTVTPGQLSVAVATKVTTAPQSPGSFDTVIGAGHVMTGASVSLTVTVNEQLEVLPLPSSAVQVTVVVPTEKLEPDAGTQVTVGAGLQLSVAVAVKLTTAAQVPTSLLTTIGAGQVMTGASSSKTVTVNEQVAALPAESVAVQVTVAVPSANVEPDAGTQTRLGPPPRATPSLPSLP